MSDTLSALQAKYPAWKIVSPPDPQCGCRGDGEITTKSGRTQPCLCVCLSDIAGWSRADMVREVGNAARRVARREQTDDGR